MLTVLRKDQLHQIPVTVGDYAEQTTPAITTTPPKNQLGIEVDNLSPELSQKLGYSQDQGVVITRISPYSAAALAGLKKGALILSVNRQKVTNVDEFNRALTQTPKDRPILLQIKQGDIYLFVSLQTE
jgi:serine protease Do